MRAACALRISSGRIILNFGMAERLRTLRHPIFTGEIAAVSGIYRRQGKPSPSSLRDATSPERGRVIASNRKV